jgi:hypothetical protein
MRPMLGREVVKGKQDFFIFLQAFAGFREFSLVTGDKLFVGCQSFFAGGPDRAYPEPCVWPRQGGNLAGL